MNGTGFVFYDWTNKCPERIPVIELLKLIVNTWTYCRGTLEIIFCVLLSICAFCEAIKYISQFSFVEEFLLNHRETFESYADRLVMFLVETYRLFTHREKVKIRIIKPNTRRKFTELHYKDLDENAIKLIHDFGIDATKLDNIEYLLQENVCRFIFEIGYKDKLKAYQSDDSILYDKEYTYNYFRVMLEENFSKEQALIQSMIICNIKNHLSNQVSTRIFYSSKCVICYEMESSYILENCFHECICKNCIDSYVSRNSDCPICRAPIEEAYHTYFSFKKVDDNN